MTMLTDVLIEPMAEEEINMCSLEKACSAELSQTASECSSDTLISHFSVHQVDLKGEDRWRIRRIDIGGESVLFCLVADGHGGAQAAEYCAAHMIDHIETLAADNPCQKSLRRATVAAFRAAHQHMLNVSGCNAGASLTIVAMNEHRRELVVCNVGDSHAISVEAGEQNFEVLTADHRLETNKKEQARVVKAGSKVGRALDHAGVPNGPLRAFPGGVCLARAIGDADAGAAISPEPHTYECKLSPRGGALVLASDGVWDAMPMPRVARSAGQNRSSAGAAYAVVRRAVQTTNQRRASTSGAGRPIDDTTCIVVAFEPCPHGDGYLSEQSSSWKKLTGAVLGAMARSPKGQGVARKKSGMGLLSVPSSRP